MYRQVPHLAASARPGRHFTKPLASLAEPCGPARTDRAIPDPVADTSPHTNLRLEQTLDR